VFKTLLFTEAPVASAPLVEDMQDAGFDIMHQFTDTDNVAQTVMQQKPDLMIAASHSPSDNLFEVARTLGLIAPCPIVLFTSDDDHSKIDKATEAGIHAYVIDGYAKHRLRSIVQVARARFRHNQFIKDELSNLSKRFEERKLLDRAKGVLMRSRGINEEESFELLRSLAMKTRQRIGVVAKSVIDMSFASEAVNRAGQLRMLSQRVVKFYTQIAIQHQIAESSQLLADCILRVDYTLGILNKAVNKKGYGDLIDRVANDWQQMLLICNAPAQLTQIIALDEYAERMLKNAENLTDFLENSGFVATLHILNVSGRQRMLSQRISKLCYFLLHAAKPEYLTQIQHHSDQFESALDYLTKAPLSTALIMADLKIANAEWICLKAALENLQAADALTIISDASESLLDVFERLTDQYEKAMQILIGDRLVSI
jgi:AmiR/NasT family two-component response regulator